MMLLAHYILLGFEHVLPLGYDHLLFICALFFLNSRIKSAILQCTVFTIAHSITLALTAVGTIHFNEKVCETLIAFSIFLVAIENLYFQTVRLLRLVLVFVFGLVHGMGFATALREAGLPKEDFIIGLLGFNIGVEFAQITIVMILYYGIAKRLASKSSYQASIVPTISISIACIGIFWCIARLLQ